MKNSDYKNFQKNGWRRFIENKNSFYRFLLIGIAIIVILAAAAIFFPAQERDKEKNKAEEAKQPAEQTLEQKRKNAVYSRFTFFLASPAGERGGMNMPTYQEGSWRIPDALNKDKKMTILYVKNSETGVPLMHIRYGSRQNFKIEPGEKELKTDSQKLIYVYYFYPAGSFLGADQEDFAIVQEDFTEALKTFGTF